LTEEEAYLEIAKKLMKLSDVLGELETCMERELTKKFSTN
jgi:16S rRNA C1402 (ribose-2'-O) methylase RsmI